MLPILYDLGDADSSCSHLPRLEFFLPTCGRDATVVSSGAVQVVVGDTGRKKPATYWHPGDEAGPIHLNPDLDPDLDLDPALDPAPTRRASPCACTKRKKTRIPIDPEQGQSVLAGFAGNRWTYVVHTPEQAQTMLMCPGMPSGGIWRKGTGRSAIVSIMEIPQWKNRRCNGCPIF